MSVKLNRDGFDHVKDIIREGCMVQDEKDEWSKHQPSAEKENDFIHRHRITEFAKRQLGIDDEESDQNKGRYKFPYGDLKKVHRCAVLSAESRAGWYNYYDIENAAAHLHGTIDARQPAHAKH